MTQRILEELSRTGIALLLREPFYAHLYGSLTKQVVSKGHPVETLAVGTGSDQNLTLYTNADFWDNTLTHPDHRYGVMKHEILHLVFHHVFIKEPHLDPRLLNVAFDLVVNQYIERHQLPDDSIFLDSFPDLRLQSGQTWFYYYKKLETLHHQQAGDESNMGESAQALQQIQPDSNGLDRHQPWREIQNRSELENSVTENHLDSLMRTAHQRTSAHAWGNMPGQVQEILQRLLLQPTPEVNWKAALRLFVGSNGQTRLRNTIQRASKRYGTTPGLKIRRLQRLMVAVDTSGSIAQEDLDLFFSEIYYIWRAGAEIEIVECDTRIEHRYPYRGAAPQRVSGRGGTNYAEPLQAANRERPDGLIYFTDGYAATPELRSHVPVLWVVTQQGLDPAHPSFARLPGRKIKMRR